MATATDDNAEIRNCDAHLAENIFQTHSGNQLVGTLAYSPSLRFISFIT